MSDNKALTEWARGIATQLRRDGYMDAAELIEQLTAEPTNDPLTLKTNADRIRAMSDVELAREINLMFKCDAGWQKELLVWLQQPAPEEGKQNV